MLWGLLQRQKPGGKHLPTKIHTAICHNQWGRQKGICHFVCFRSPFVKKKHFVSFFGHFFACPLLPPPFRDRVTPAKLTSLNLGASWPASTLQGSGCEKITSWLCSWVFPMLRVLLEIICDRSCPVHKDATCNHLLWIQIQPQSEPPRFFGGHQKPCKPRAEGGAYKIHAAGNLKISSPAF